ncbi:MAG: phosphoglucosamine mutase [bacterium]|nr:phosphoglucosamine mutase [bacterium]
MPLIRSVSGVRGIVDAACGQPVTLNPEVAADLGRAFATFLRSQADAASGPARCALGALDGRPGGRVLLEAFSHGAAECGLGVVPLGIVTTPGTALAVCEYARTLGVCGGVVITASHNPQQWNGIKMLLTGGGAPSAEQAAIVFDIGDRGAFDRVDSGTSAPLPDIPDVHELHLTRVLALVRPDTIRARRFRVILDSINGAGTYAGRLLLERLGCKVTQINAEPETGFPRSPEPTESNLVDFCKMVAGGDFDVGFVQDPDADRLAVVDEAGRYIGEEYTLALAAKHVFATRPGPAVANLSTSRMIDDLAAATGGPCTVHRSAVGEANVVEVIRRVGAHLGGEGNGGVIDPRVVHVRDSLVGMALVLQLLADEAKPLSAVVADIPRYAIVKDKFEADSGRIARILAAVRDRFGDQRINDLDGLRIDWDDGWVHVRGSNTEPILRIIAEADAEASARALIDRVRQVADGVQ